MLTWARHVFRRRWWVVMDFDAMEGRTVTTRLWFMPIMCLLWAKRFGPFSSESRASSFVLGFWDEP